MTASKTPRDREETSRHAALLLHAMPDMDRSWVLEQLPATQQTLLLAHLKELKDLGIPRDRHLIDEAVATMREPTSPAPVSLSQLDSHGVRTLCNLLSKEPAMLVARLLACGPWAWENELLSMLTPPQRQQIQRFRTTLTDSEAHGLKSALVQRIEAHLFQSTEERPGKQAHNLPPKRRFNLLPGFWRAKVST